jgi:glyoxylase-like metal-dependent hydrolase (beta-lactamase superfamily II)
MEYTNQVEWLPNEGWDPRIHVAANGDLVNVFVLVTERFVVLVDTLLNPITANTLVEYAQAYLPGRQLLVINSHSDWDHAWGNQLFAGPNAPYPAPIIAHVASTSLYDGPEKVESLRKMQSEQPDIFADVAITKPTLTFHSRFDIDGGDLTLHLFPTPGHTPDHIAIFIPEISTLLAGDAAEIPYPIVYNALDLPVLRASLTAMANLQPQMAFYCHAPPSAGPQLLHDNIAYYDALEAACRSAMERGLTITQLADTELPAALECNFTDVTPTTGAWTSVSPYSRTERHGQQLRLMWAWVEQSKRVREEP